MHTEAEWAETVSSKIWNAPMAKKGRERLSLEVDWEPQWGLQGYLVDLWHGIKSLTKKFHAYTKLKNG